MFERLDLPPLVLVLLLLYGLLIAFIYTLWTALNLRRRKAKASSGQPVQTEAPERTAKPTPPPAASETVKPWLAKPAEAPRPADSETVASYSVRKRAEAQPAPAPAERVTPQQPEAPRPRAAVTPPPVTTRPREQEKPREQPRPQQQKPPVKPVRPAQPSRPANNEERARNEDAFARFLRSSGEDRDDF